MLPTLGEQNEGPGRAPSSRTRFAQKRKEAGAHLFRPQDPEAQTQEPVVFGREHRVLVTDIGATCFFLLPATEA